MCCKPPDAPRLLPVQVNPAAFIHAFKGKEHSFSGFLFPWEQLLIACVSLIVLSVFIPCMRKRNRLCICGKKCFRRFTVSFFEPPSVIKIPDLSQCCCNSFPTYLLIPILPAFCRRHQKHSSVVSLSFTSFLSMINFVLKSMNILLFGIPCRTSLFFRHMVS